MDSYNVDMITECKRIDKEQSIYNCDPDRVGRINTTMW